MSQLLPDGYFEFERNPEIKRYEDEYIVCKRMDDGSVTMEGKPMKSVFIYAEEA